MKVVISIAQSLNHHKNVISWTDIFIVRSLTDRVSNTVDCECIVEVDTISRHHTHPKCNPNRFTPKVIRHEQRNDNNEQQKGFSKVSVLKHDRFISTKIAYVDRFQSLLTLRSVLHANPTDVREKSTSSDVVRILRRNYLKKLKYFAIIPTSISF